MKKIFAWMLIMLLSIAACGEEQVYYAAENRSWYHIEEGCDFGGFALGRDFEEPEFRALTKPEAEAEYLRPCPACAREWQAAFSGDFPEWSHEIAPWALDGGEETHLPYEIRKAWGDFSGKMYEEYGEGPFPDGYAGLYVNASGSVTLLLVDPSPERMDIICRYMGAEFWALDADFDRNYLDGLQGVISGMMGDIYGIHVCGISVDGNCVMVGVDDDAPEIREEICRAIEEKGYDRRAIIIRQEERMRPLEF